MPMSLSHRRNPYPRPPPSRGLAYNLNPPSAQPTAARLTLRPFRPADTPAGIPTPAQRRAGPEPARRSPLCYTAARTHNPPRSGGTPQCPPRP